jgi:S1-C subfamily serine protease
MSLLLSAQLPRMPDTLPEQSASGDTSGVIAYTPPPSVRQTGTMAPAYVPQQPAYAPPQRPYAANVAEHVVGVYGGPNGPGSGFFVAPEGIVATTRYISGGMERLTVETQPGRQLPAALLRAYPDLDLALLRVEYAPASNLAMTPLPRVPDETPLTAVLYQRAIASGLQRSTKRALAAHWIPTNFTSWEDAGGAPLFDPNYYLVGMATKNTARNSGHYFALHIAAIHARVDALLAEIRVENRAYCPSCGGGSKAGALGFFYCESCGSVMPPARHVQRFPLPQAEALYETGRVRCTRCGAQVGFHGGRCLRCGQPPETRPLT